MWRSFLAYSSLVKLSHSIFALPFALAAAVLAARTVDVTAAQIGWILVCMIGARTSAMGVNRIADRAFDARNPRTQSREIVTGAVGVPAAIAFTGVATAAFVLGSWALGPQTLALSPIALLVLWGYSWTKRFTAWCHVVLGVALALAPTAVWIALTGGWGWVPALLSLAVGTWVAGFDLIYACQDAAFDRAAGLSSVPARFGARAALRASSALHVVTVAALAALPAVIDLGIVYAVGLLAIAGVLIHEHRLVNENDLSKVDKAFFDLNGYVALLFFGAVLLA